MFRDGPVRVAKDAEHFAFLPLSLPTGVQSAADVRLYQVRPWLTRLGAWSRASVSYGSNAFGQPTQPASEASEPHVCHVLSRSGWPKSVPPSSTAACTPAPVKPAFHAPVKLWVFASSAFSRFSASKLDGFSGGALSYGTEFFWNSRKASLRVFLSGWLPTSGSTPSGCPVRLN